MAVPATGNWGLPRSITRSGSAAFRIPTPHRTGRHWAQIASTNPLERVNKEIKGRSRVVGIFPNDAAIVRLVGALLIEQTATDPRTAAGRKPAGAVTPK